MAKTVIVACKIPTGLILQLRDETTPSMVRWQASLKGSAIDMQPFVLEDGVGLTEVDAAGWEEWAAWADKNRYAPYVKGLIFAAYKGADVKAQAREMSGVLSGLEGLNVPLRETDPVPAEPRLAEVRGAGLSAVQA